MPCDLNLRLRRALIWYTRPKAGMRPAAVVMRRPRFQGLPNVRFVERDYKVQTLSASTTDQALAKSIGLGRFVRSLQDGQPQRFQRCVQLAGIDPVTVMDHKSVTFIVSFRQACVGARGVSWLRKRTQSWPASGRSSRASIRRARGRADRRCEARLSDSRRDSGPTADMCKSGS